MEGSKMKITQDIINNCDIPELTVREWKSRKRKQIREVIKAIKKMRLGCAFFPNGKTEIDELEEKAEQLKRVLSVDNWGR